MGTFINLFPKSKSGKLRLGILTLVLLVVLVRFAGSPMYGYLRYHPQEGDIIFQSLPRVELVRAIEGITESPLSHCGVVVDRNGKWYVNESIGEVHDTSLLGWIARGRGGGFSVYRLKKEFRQHIPSFIEALKNYDGRPYDYKYKMDDDYIYCSELVFKAFRDASGVELGKFVRLGDMNWKPFEATIRRFENGDPPLGRLMITPRHLAEAEQLEKVFAN